MVAPEQEPLGFSDLYADEELVIIMYREWRRCGSGAIAEHSIARQMRDHPVYQSLVYVFDAFSEAEPKDETWQDPGLLMSRDEERVLTMLSARIRASEGETLAPATVFIRQADDIPRSGRDRLIARINGSYGQAATMYRTGEKRLLH